MHCACIINEKPSQSRNFAKAFGGMTGSINGEPYTITSLRGHVVEFKDPSEMVPRNMSEKIKAWSLNNEPWDAKDFSWEYKVRGDTKTVISTLKSQLLKCDKWIIATDDDPSGEGQLLAWEAIAFTGVPLPAGGVWRMYFEDESPASIKKAYANMKRLPLMVKDPEYMKAFFRARWDFMSMQFTRVATLLTPTHVLIRLGRLKSPMVTIVGDQTKAHDEYVKHTSYQNRFRDENDVVYKNPEEPTFDDKGKVPQDYHDSRVICDSKVVKHSAPRRLFDLSDGASHLSAKGIKPDVLQDRYQKMYEAGVLSYIRSEDHYITIEQFNELLPHVDEIARLVGVDTSILTHRQPRKTHIREGMAHGANRPGPNVPVSLAELNTKFGSHSSDIYVFFAKSFLMMFAEDYEYEQQKGHLEDYPKFVGSVNVPLKQGWHAVDKGFVDEDKDVSAKGLGTLAKPFVADIVNPRPGLPTVKFLMKKLSSLDIGTGATRVSTLNEITKSNENALMKESRGKLSLTERGKIAYYLLPDTHIGDLMLTKRVQEQMAGIAAGKLDADECLSEIADFVRDDTKTMTKNAVTMRETLGLTDAPADKEYAEGNFGGKPIKFNRVWGGHRFTDAEVADLLAGKEITVTHIKSSSGSEYGVKGRLEEQTYKGKKFWGFSKTEFVNADGSANAASNSDDYAEGTWKRKKVRFKRVWGGHRFTDAEVADLLAGKDVSITGLKSNSGNTYGVVGHLSTQTYNGRKYVGFEKVSFLGNDGKPAAASSNGSSDYAEGTWNGKQVRFKRVFRGKKLTAAQIKKLLAGNEVEIKGLKAKSGREYGCKVKLANLEYNGHKYVGLEQVGFI